jgi:hypothetical protein
MLLGHRRHFRSIVDIDVFTGLKKVSGMPQCTAQMAKKMVDPMNRFFTILGCFEAVNNIPSIPM